MFLSLLFHIFFSNQFDLSKLEVETTIIDSAHAAEPEVIVVQGFDEATTLPFFHSLPVPSAQANSFGPQRIDNDSLGILTTADSVLVLDERTNLALFNKSAEDIRPIASITKLMSALVLLDTSIDFDKVVTITVSDYRAGGIIHFYSGEQILMNDLWMSALIASDNVAIAALVRETGLTLDQFAARMNEKARELGMDNSLFVEPTGIDANNVSTAKELAILIREAMSRDKIVNAVKRSNYSFPVLNKNTTRYLKNTNAILSSFINKDPYQVVGGKTGFTFEAGYCLGVYVDGPGDNDDIIVVVLGSDSAEDRFQEVKGLVDWTYQNYIW